MPPLPYYICSKVMLSGSAVVCLFHSASHYIIYIMWYQAVNSYEEMKQ